MTRRRYKRHNRNKLAEPSIFNEVIFTIFWFPFEWIGTRLIYYPLVDFFKKGLGVTCRTKRGEKVRSKAEKKIADFFHDHNIEYVYEKSIRVGWLRRKLLPDFYLVKYDTYFEYFGLTRHPKVGSLYRKRMREKLSLYEKHKVRIFWISDSQKGGLITLLKGHLARLESNHLFSQKKTGDNAG